MTTNLKPVSPNFESVTASAIVLHPLDRKSLEAVI